MNSPHQNPTLEAHEGAPKFQAPGLDSGALRTTCKVSLENKGFVVQPPEADVEAFQSWILAAWQSRLDSLSGRGS